MEAATAESEIKHEVRTAGLRGDGVCAQYDDTTAKLFHHNYLTVGFSLNFFHLFPLASQNVLPFIDLGN